MSLRGFLVSLLDTGKVRVDRPWEVSARDLVGAEDLLRQMDGRARLELAFDPPRRWRLRGARLEVVYAEESR